MASVSYPMSANALPLLLAAFPPSLENLDILVAMADITDALHRIKIDNVPWSQGRPERLSSPTSNVLYYNIESIIAGLADQTHDENEYSLGKRETLDAYIQYREVQRAYTREAFEFAVQAMEPDAEDLPHIYAGIEDMNYLDSLTWQLADALGLYRQPQVLNAAQMHEVAILMFARQLIINND